MLFGTLSGLSSALIWSASSLIVKAQAARIDTLSFNTFRQFVGALFFLALLPFFGGLAPLVALPPATALALTISVILGIGVGDSIYFWSLTKIGASRAMPLSGIYPLFTWILAVPILGERVTLAALLGTGLILCALYLLAQNASPEPNDYMITTQDVTALPRDTERSRNLRLGVAAAVFAAFTWACSTTLLRLTLHDDTNALVVNAFRLTVGALALLPVVHFFKGNGAWRGYSRAALPALIALGILSTGIGSLLWVWSVQFAGAARAALFNTTSPLIGVPLSVIFLRERVTWRVAVGSVLAVAGVPGWPQCPVPVPSFSRRYAMHWESFPASFVVESEAFLTRSGNQDPFADDYAPSVKPSTVAMRRKQILQIATALVHSGVAATDITGLAVLVKPENAQRAVAPVLDGTIR